MQAAYCWAVLSITDFLDGFLARKLNVESLLGKFLDPLADKLLVMALLVYLVPMGRIPAWVVVALVAREIAVTGLRSIASNEQIVIGAGSGGKWKTALQMVGILCLILHFPHRVMPFWPHPVSLNVVGQWLVLLSLGFSLTSAIEYFGLFVSAIEAREKREEEESSSG
jgi:CDP-diacylglycerol--glycerol-3-phosphate 3-phosphatidyltransferase